MAAQIHIPSRFNGPPDSGNGGYSCGVVANFIDGPARVRLHVPPPLDTPMTVATFADGRVELRDASTLVASAAPTELALEVPAAPGVEEAAAAMARHPARDAHMFPTCFVCGTKRPQHDGMELYPGPVNDWNLLACVWHPDASFADDNGNIRAEFMWSALDCPGYYAALRGEMRHAVLGQLEGQLLAPVAAGQTLVVYAWPMGNDGRKHYGGTAVASASGEVYASARTTWIELKS
ncbi:MAG: hypothetical protein NXI15_10680 [Gammaproteobacteria bacterium]|jgi:hypothetical protein|nr:hypothetical protein [Gammaproteobacteria bacterium]